MNSKVKTNLIEMYDAVLRHAVSCNKMGFCDNFECIRLKRLLGHLNSCGGISQNRITCNTCKRLLALFIYHSRKCKERGCRVPSCSTIKTIIIQNSRFKLLKQILLWLSLFCFICFLIRAFSFF